MCWAFWSPWIRSLLVFVMSGGSGSMGVLRRGRRSGGGELACWSFRPRARCPPRRRPLRRRCGAAEVGLGRVRRSSTGARLVVSGGRFHRRCAASVVAVGGSPPGRRMAMLVQRSRFRCIAAGGSCGLRQQALRPSPVVVCGRGFIFSGVGSDGATVLGSGLFGRVYACVLCMLLCTVLCYP